MAASLLVARAAFAGSMWIRGRRRREAARPASWTHTCVAAFIPSVLFLWLGWSGGSSKLPLGIADDVSAAVAVVEQSTTPAARILWEESADTDAWTPLLPHLTDRPLMGGMGQPASIEHAAARLRDGLLAGHWLSLWTDAELSDYCRRYNIGWIVCHTAAAKGRIAKWSAAESTSLLPNGDALFAIRREPTYFLVGQGKVARCDMHALTLTDIEPVNGQIILSFHCPPHIWAASQWARVDKKPQAHDAIPFLRLRLAEPMTRLTLYWNGE
jgi:hypothetical protein